MLNEKNNNDLYIINIRTFENKQYLLDYDYEFKEGICDKCIFNYNDINFKRLEKESKQYGFTYNVEKWNEL